MRRLPANPRFRLLALAAMAGGLFVIGAICLPHSPSEIRAAVAGYGWAAPLLFGPGLGTAVGVAGATLGGLISFAIARRCGAAAFEQVAPPKLRRIEDRLSSHPLRSLLLLRVMPGMPSRG